LSTFSPTEFIATLERNDLGFFAAFIPARPQTGFQFARAISSALSDQALVSSEKIGVNAIAATGCLNPSRSKRF
jgi:hypothetical protein